MKSGFASPLRLADEKAESFGVGFTNGWRHGRAFEQLEADRAAELRKPLPADLNPPELLAKVRVRVLKPFGLGKGKVAEVGATIELQRHDALSLAAIKKVEILMAGAATSATGPDFGAGGGGAGNAGSSGAGGSGGAMRRPTE